MGLLAPFCDKYCPQQLSILKIQGLRTVYHKKLEGLHNELYQHILSVRIVKLIESTLLVNHAQNSFSQNRSQHEGWTLLVTNFCDKPYH